MSARASASAVVVSDDRRPGHLADLIAAEIRERWHDRAWYRRRRDIAAGTARSYEGALDRRGHWQELIDENDRELRTLLRVLRKARRSTLDERAEHQRRSDYYADDEPFTGGL